MLPGLSSVAVGNRVRYKEWPAVVWCVNRSGTVDLDWTGPPPHPFFRGPYRLDELEADDGR